VGVGEATLLEAVGVLAAVVGEALAAEAASLGEAVVLGEAVAVEAGNGFMYHKNIHSWAGHPLFFQKNISPFLLISPI
jgi:hypothetical protein